MSWVQVLNAKFDTDKTAILFLAKYRNADKSAVQVKNRNWRHVYHMGQRLILISVCSQSVSKLIKTSFFLKSDLHSMFEELICLANICRLFLYPAGSYLEGQAGRQLAVWGMRNAWENMGRTKSPPIKGNRSAGTAGCSSGSHPPGWMCLWINRERKPTI